jgi:hypothetical protein
MAGAIVVSVVAGLGLPSCASDGDAEEGATPPPTGVAPPTTRLPTARELVDAVEVVGSGLTEAPVMGCNSPAGEATGFYPDTCPPEHREPISDSSSYGSISYGFVVENTSDHVILRLPVQYSFLDAEGEEIVEHANAFSDDDPTGDTATIPVLRPGERAGIGGMTYPGRPGAAEIQVEVGEPGDWVPEGAWYVGQNLGRQDRGEVTVTELDVQPGEDGEPVTTFTVESSYEQARPSADVYVVFYDAEGRIVGGAMDVSVIDIPAGDTASGRVALDDPLAVPGIDPSRTEIYVPGLRMAPR